jgi:3-ketosteroid 9alpha-monooxygenase subunit B
MTDASLQTRRSVLVTVADVIDESPDARSLVFTVPEDQQERFSYRPGQFAPDNF